MFAPFVSRTEEPELDDYMLENAREIWNQLGYTFKTDGSRFSSIEQFAKALYLEGDDVEYNVYWYLRSTDDPPTDL